MYTASDRYLRVRKVRTLKGGQHGAGGAKAWLPQDAQAARGAGRDACARKARGVGGATNTI